MPESIHISSYASPFGELLLGDYRGKLCLCDWKFRKLRRSIDERIEGRLQAKYEEGTSPLLEEAHQQLQAYFLDGLRSFSIPLELAGSEFQQQVWKQLLTIPYGTTQSYLTLSRKLGNEKAIRAVSAANGANAISIFIPCHRIMGSNGDLVGYAGGLGAKKNLLQLENALPQQELFV